LHRRKEKASAIPLVITEASLMHPTSQPIDLMWVLNKWKYNSTPVYGVYVEEQTLRYAAQISD